MPKIGKYCKAYLLKDLRKFSQWCKYANEVKIEKKLVDEKEIEMERNLIEDDILYLQDNYVVTGEIFNDENIVFKIVTPEWKDFCTKNLNFVIPVHETAEL